MQQTNKLILFRTVVIIMVLMLAAACSSSMNNGPDTSHSTTTGDTATGDTATESAEGSNTKEDRSQSKGEASEPATESERTEGGDRRYTSQQAEVKAGQLTAGEWDDLAAWQRFGNLLNSKEGDDNLSYWSFQAFNRLEVVVTSGGRAVSDAIVKLSDNQRQLVWEAHTNTDGKAYLFAGLYNKGQNDKQSNYRVDVQAGQYKKSLSQISLPEQGTLKVDLGGEAELANQVDIMFVVDTTGSMEDELRYLEAELKDVIGRVGQQHGQQLDIRLSANFYKDKSDDYTVKSFPFTKDVDEVVRQLAAEKADGGGDYPEAVDAALRDAVHSHDWSEQARARLLFLVLDAPPHYNTKVVNEIQELIQTAAADGIRIIPVASSGVDVQTEYLLRFMAVATGGTYLFLTDDSGIGGDHLEPAAGEYEVKPLNDLLVEMINRFVQP
ncbi:von Willebrand factor type A domain-containing protein [Paenibacillus algorifonticola]|uniref:von Willebrand factor type A domain-containing protein n=1 Tax=Paenibacillus algorifonticola TaxID=684063 RepID=A0A1I2G5D0_9BACL|nr:vWA domain-containing protein [Paenibacillus algorifonticola]SFF12190.1 von Willebrand factor type A domain-containing protein [Paenibacillus algorifonticola]